MRKAFVLLVPLRPLGLYLGIKLDDGARNVRTAWNGDVGSCEEQGKVTVSVMNRVGPVDRSDLKVRDELEVLARNEAAKMGADTIKPLAEPSERVPAVGRLASCGSRAVEPARGNTPSPPQEHGPAGWFRNRSAEELIRRRHARRSLFLDGRLVLRIRHLPLAECFDERRDFPHDQLWPVHVDVVVAAFRDDPTGKR